MCNPWRVMLSSCVILAALAGVSSSAAPPQAAGSVRLSIEPPDDSSAGMRLFTKKSCALCHSLGGKNQRAGPDLGQTRTPGTVLDLVGAFWNHAPAMRAKMQELKLQPPTLTPEEMANLVAFLTAFRYYQTSLGEPGHPNAGRAVFVAKACAGCHDDDAVHGRLGPNLESYRGRFSGLYLAQAMWNHGPEMAAAMRHRGVAWPLFREREMTDLVAYLQGGHAGNQADQLQFLPGNPRQGRVVFSQKRCSACHPVDGSTGTGPDLALRGLVASAPTIAGIMWNHSQGMVAEFARRGITQVRFEGSEMADVIAYLYFINYATAQGSPARGARHFKQKCSACHGPEGHGTAPVLVAAPRLQGPIAIITAMWNHAPRMEEELRTRGLEWPRFGPGEAADLVAYLLAGRSTAGTTTPAGPR